MTHLVRPASHRAVLTTSHLMPRQSITGSRNPSVLMTVSAHFSKASYLRTFVNFSSEVNVYFSALRMITVLTHLPVTSYHVAFQQRPALHLSLAEDVNDGGELVVDLNGSVCQWHISLGCHLEDQPTGIVQKYW